MMERDQRVAAGAPARDTDVLIAGAGPTGLALALALHRLGVPFRIVDKAAAAGTTSRALILHARTLELYRQIGVADAVIAAAHKVEAVNLWTGGRVRARLPFGDIGARVSPYPYSVIFPQDAHERLLIGVLRDRGVEVERAVELTGLAVDARGVCATLRGSAGTERVTARFVAGCDGAHSAVREGLGVALPGGTYDHLWYVADVVAHGPLANGEINVSMSTRDALAVMPMGGDEIRLVGQAAPNADGSPPAWDAVDKRLLAELRTQVEAVRWFSTYRVHHRVASAFRRDAGFLVGDAAHLHSPVGGQGMNTGIGDAFNLAWKLAAVARGDAEPALLDTYEAERIAFARQLVATTDRVFSLLNGESAPSVLFRTVIAPTFMPLLLRTGAGRRAAFRILSQTAIEYRRGGISAGRAGAVRGGDRLPWAGDTDNFAPLASLAWQAHVYGDPSPQQRARCARRALPLHAFPWSDGARRAGLARDALYVVRPDGYVGLADASPDAHAIDGYLPSYRFAGAAVA
ncbi:MAG TPA: FAD-dependent monooxygenase [Candidatus Elarobacter sp.]|nr:FAD-dependent monooxygenase [Candidatus Elarobacter sp.]